MFRVSQCNNAGGSYFMITLLGNAIETVVFGGTYTDAGATALDDVDGNITASIVVGGDTVDENTVGTYVITYDVVDSSSNAAVQVSRSVTVIP